jgi:hypothetical protein
VIQPYRFEPRRNQINPTYFRVSAGQATANGDPAAHWRVTVNNGSLDADSSFLVKSPNNALKNIEKFFLVATTSPSSGGLANGVAKTAVMRIISATNVDANQHVVVAPNRTYAGDVNFGMPAVGAPWVTMVGGKSPAPRSKPITSRQSAS